jgi:hypothetical protein
MADQADEFQDAEPPVEPPAATTEATTETADSGSVTPPADSQMVQEDEIPNTVVITGIPAAEQVR